MTNIDICNMALAHIAKGRIISLDSQVEEARQCKIYYEHLRKTVLTDFNWGFAKRIVPLALLDVKVASWDYVYAYPNQCIAARLIFNKDGAKVREFEKEKFDVFLVGDSTKAIGCDIANASLEYTYDAKEPDLYSAEFIEALSRLLASAIAISLTGNANLQATQYQFYQVALNKARYASATERERKPMYPNTYGNARFS
ncbi:hypothetical protein LJC10_05795 [Selenomonadales bacterium OttesenSCG-928-I06]|nr:hypothetical protein [Selenomonadales bacterium OttesenSCG-928-I06]